MGPPWSPSRALRKPVVAVLLANAKNKRQTSPSPPPKGANHGPCTFSPCIRAVSRDPREGAIIAPSAPGPGAALRAKAMPPLWQYFSRLRGKD
jgi:hypothetical protein